MRFPYLGFLLTIIAVPCFAKLPVDGQVTGTAEIPSVVGRSTQPGLPLGGASLFFSPANGGPGIARFCADGQFSVVLAPGDYRVLLEPAEPYRRGEILEGLRIGVGALRWDPQLAPDYNCAFRTMTDWHHDPWAWGRVFEQTFVARGTSITSAAFRFAGINGEVVLRASIVRGPGGPQVGPERLVPAKAIDDLFVSWESGEVPTVPGETYALRVEDSDGKVATGLFVRREHGWGYPFGDLYIDGEKQAADGYFYIGSNADGTILAYTKTAGDPPAPVPGTGSWSQPILAQGSSFGAVAVPLLASEPPERVQVEIRTGATGETAPNSRISLAVAAAGEGRFLAGSVCPPGTIPLVPGQTYTLVIVTGTQGASPILAAGTEAQLAMRVYEYSGNVQRFLLPPVPEPVPDLTKSLLPLDNAGFETGTTDGWELAWGGAAPIHVVGADWMAEQFAGDSQQPKEGQYCGVVAAERNEVKTLIRRWSFWPYPSENGLMHARVWVASSKAVAHSDTPLTVRLCVSDHGSADAGGVEWSEPMIADGRWRLLESPPVVPKGGKLSAFLLVEGGSQHDMQYVKFDQLELVVDEK